jgi:hypothetical protein
MKTRTDLIWSLASVFVPTQSYSTLPFSINANNIATITLEIHWFDMERRYKICKRRFCSVYLAKCIFQCEGKNIIRLSERAFNTMIITMLIEHNILLPQNHEFCVLFMLKSLKHLFLKIIVHVSLYCLKCFYFWLTWK